MKLYNKSENGFSHAMVQDGKTTLYTLNVGEIKEIPNEIAKIWLKFKGVVKYVDPKDAQALEQENAALKAQAKAAAKAQAKK